MKDNKQQITYLNHPMVEAAELSTSNCRELEAYVTLLSHDRRDTESFDQNCVEGGDDE